MKKYNVEFFKKLGKNIQKQRKICDYTIKELSIKSGISAEMAL